MSKLKYYDGTNWKVVNGQITGDTLPIGSQVPYGSTTAPANWLVCDGSYVSKTTYSELYAVIGDSYLEGGTAPEGTFRLPNKKGRNSIGYDPNDSDFNSIGKTGGSKALQQHNHSVIGQAVAVNGPNQQVSNNGVQLGGAWGPSTMGLNKSATENTGTGNSENLQPYETDCWIIKAKQSSGLIANVSNTQSNSQSDTYSCDYVNDHFDLKPTVLFDGNSATTITLSDNASNYTYIEIEYRRGDFHKSTGKLSHYAQPLLDGFWVYYDSGASAVVSQSFCEIPTVSGTSITRGTTYYSNVINGSVSTGDFSGGIFIRKVIGYK